VDALAKAARFDPYHDAMNHKREHSIEFQAAFLRHLLGKREARIIPILAGLGDAQARRRSPRQDAKVASFFDAVKKLVDGRKGRIVVVAGADLAHVGPRFGDAAFDVQQRAALEATDSRVAGPGGEARREGLLGPRRRRSRRAACLRPRSGVFAPRSADADGRFPG